MLCSLQAQSSVMFVLQTIRLVPSLKLIDTSNAPLLFCCRPTSGWPGTSSALPRDGSSSKSGKKKDSSETFWARKKFFLRVKNDRSKYFYSFFLNLDLFECLSFDFSYENFFLSSLVYDATKVGLLFFSSDTRCCDLKWNFYYDEKSLNFFDTDLDCCLIKLLNDLLNAFGSYLYLVRNRL